MAKVPLTVRIEDIEMARLKEFCSETGRTQSDVVRELIRRLKIKPSLSGAEDGVLNPNF